MEPTPDCVIKVSYFKAPDAAFAYYCISHSSSWQVSFEGTICPPRRSRRIYLEPADPETALAGIRLAYERAVVVNSTDVYLNKTGLEVKPDDDQGYPTQRIEIVDLIHDHSASEPGSSRRVFFALGLRIDGVDHWNDPKIYNPADD